MDRFSDSKSVHFKLKGYRTTYFCHQVSNAWQWVPAAYLGSTNYSSKVHDLTFNPAGDIYISGLLNDVNWGTGAPVTANEQQMILKYDSNLGRKWINPTVGDHGIENTQSGITTGASYSTFTGKLSYIGNFIGTSKVFDNTSITTTNNEHLFVTEVEDKITYSVFKYFDEGESAIQLNPLTLYPNPSRYLFKIDGLDELKTSPIKVTDISGKLIRTLQATSQTEIIVKDWPSGVYVVKVDYNGQVQSLKLIVE